MLWEAGRYPPSTDNRIHCSYRKIGQVTTIGLAEKLLRWSLNDRKRLAVEYDPDWPENAALLAAKHGYLHFATDSLSNLYNIKGICAIQDDYKIGLELGNFCMKKLKSSSKNTSPKKRLVSEFRRDENHSSCLCYGREIRTFLWGRVKFPDSNRGIHNFQIRIDLNPLSLT